MEIVLYSSLIKSVVRYISCWLIPGNWQNEKLFCNFMTNVGFFSSRNSSPNRKKSLLFWGQYLFYFYQRSWEVHQSMQPMDKHLETNWISDLLVCHLKLDDTFCWEYKDCPNWDIIQGLVPEKHLIPSAFQSMNKANKKWWNRALRSQ